MERTERATDCFAGEHRSDRIEAIVSRLSELAGRRWALARLEEAIDAGSPIGAGVTLTGPDPEVRDVAAAVLTDVLRAEEDIASLCGEILERYEEVSLVYRLSQRLGSVIGETAIARLVLDEAASVLGAIEGEIWLHRDDVVECAAAIGERRAPVRPDRRGPFRALYDGRPWARENGPDGPAEVAVALPDPGRDALGVLVLRGRAGEKTYRSGEIKLLNAIAALTAAFVRNDRLAASARLADAKRREDDIARQVHTGLLPHRQPTFEGIDVAGICRAAETVGGDYYGFPRLADGRPAVAMADISGHGVGAALYMAAAKGVIQAEAGRLASPSDLLRRLNETLAEDFSRSNVFATAFIAKYDPEAGRIEYSNAGHNPPLLVRADGSIERLERGGLALGVLPSVLYQEASRPFRPGDRLLVYTDGLIEARDPDGRLYGSERLERFIRSSSSSSARRLCDEILAELDAFRSAEPLRDDVTLLTVIRTDEGAS